MLVTGAGGFIGRHSIAALQARGFEVHAVYSPRHTGATAADMAHHADLLQSGAAAALLERIRPTHLLHLAWITTPGVYWTSAANQAWLDASRSLLEEFLERGGERIVMAGSCAEYDWSVGGVCRETATPLADAGGAAVPAYAAAKLALQRVLAASLGRAGASGAWGRVFFQYGPGEHPERLVPYVIRQLLMAQPALCSPGTQVRSFLHVADVGAAFAALIGSSIEGVVNIGGAEPVRVADLIKQVATRLERPDLVHLGARPAAANEPAELLPDLSRLHGELGWRPRHSLATGLDDTIAWWRREGCA